MRFKTNRDIIWGWKLPLSAIGTSLLPSICFLSRGRNTGSVNLPEKNPRNIDLNLVDAQQARRVLDRLLGYQISPILWQKVRKGLSAGRVQSVTTKLICEREEEIKSFIPKEYWTIELVVLNKDGEEFTLKFYGEDGKKIDLENEAQVNKILDIINNAELTVSKIESKSRRKSAPKPFTTSVLQQDAANKLNFTTKKTMMVAQELYEGIDIKGEGTVGLISYIRTDSKRISEEAREKAKDYIVDSIGQNYYKDHTKDSKGKKEKKVQDAHEAIRPTSVERTPDSIKDSLSKDQYKLYNLIWRRFVASQMEDSIFDVLNVECNIENLVFKATGSKLKFDGYTKIYNFTDREDKILPSLSEGESLKIQSLSHLFFCKLGTFFRFFNTFLVLTFLRHPNFLCRFFHRFHRDSGFFLCFRFFALFDPLHLS